MWSPGRPSFVDIDVVGIHHQLIHIVVVVAVLGGLVDQQLADPLPLLAGEVGLEGLPQLGGGEDLLLKHQLLNGGQGVGQVGDAHLKAADEVVDREEDAYNYSAIGCVETAVPGKWGYRCTGMSFLNFPKSL